MSKKIKRSSRMAMSNRRAYRRFPLAFVAKQSNPRSKKQKSKAFNKILDDTVKIGAGLIER